MRINNLIARFLANKSTREEWEKLESWKAESQDNLTELMELKSIWHDSVDLKSYKEFNRDSAWDKINGALATNEEPTSQKSARTLNLKWVAGIAAAIAIIILAVFNFSSPSIDGYNNIAALDTIEEVDLPDGTNIFINKQSEINYAVDFRTNRSVILEGEAYFDVERDEEHPFTILTDCGIVTVLGTSFNVEENSRGVNVFVTSGSVKVTSGSDEIVLKKNDMILCGENGIEKTQAGSNYLSWKSNRLVFNDTPLHEVISDISRHFKKDISFSSSSKAMNVKVLDEFKNQNFDSVMESIVLITGIKYIKDGNKIIIQ